jgi:oxygen-independent coproporphyrinogen-3 oxidase
MPGALYLHIPFCPKVCPYCDFHKMRRSDLLVAAYLKRLRAEALELHAEFPGALDTVYFGGGTPSHLTDDELKHVVETLGRTWGFPGRVETTLEADPLTFDRGPLTDL